MSSDAYETPACPQCARKRMELLSLDVGSGMTCRCWWCGRKFQFGLWGTIVEVREAKAERKITSEKDFFFG